jgi:hypothetical protein
MNIPKKLRRGHGESRPISSAIRDPNCQFLPFGG